MPQDRFIIDDIIQLVNQIEQALQDKQVGLSGHEWQPLQADLGEVLADLSEATDDNARRSALSDLIAAFDGNDAIADHFADQLASLTKDMKLGKKRRPAHADSPKPTKNLMTRLTQSIKKLLKLSSSQQNS